MGSIPIWVTTSAKRTLGSRVQFPEAGSPRGLVKFGHVMGRGFHWDLNPGPTGGPVVTDRSTT